MTRLAAPALCGLLLLGGCRTVGPNYQRPTAPVPAAYKEAPAGWESAQPADTAMRGDWWTLYGDAELNALEPQVTVSNQSLQAAQAAFLQARALIRYYRADALPTVSVGPAISPERESANRPLSPPPATAATFNDFSLPFDVAYEPDVWGRVTREVEQQRSLAQASAADLESLRLTLQAEVAMDYFQARSLDAEAKLLADTVTADRRALQLTETRHSGGVVSAVDVAQAQTELESTLAAEQDLEVERTQLEHAIAALVGKPPADFSLPAGALAAAPPDIPVGVPASLLQRRPDIAAAERRVQAANADIGVAKSAFYPAITLSASGGLQSTAAGNLFTLPSTYWSLGAAALETVFEGGRRHALTEEALRGYDLHVADYRQSVLTAFQEVDDNLAALRVLANEQKTEQAAVSAARQSLQLSTTRYQGGVTTYLEVITAQSAALADERAAVEIQGRRFVASVLLIKALGGGWRASSLPALGGAQH